MNHIRTTAAQESLQMGYLCFYQWTVPHFALKYPCDPPHPTPGDHHLVTVNPPHPGDRRALTWEIARWAGGSVLTYAATLLAAVGTTTVQGRGIPQGIVAPKHTRSRVRATKCPTVPVVSPFGVSAVTTVPKRLGMISWGEQILSPCQWSQLLARQRGIVAPNKARDHGLRGIDALQSPYTVGGEVPPPSSPSSNV